MSKMFVKMAVSAVMLLILTVATVIWHNNGAFAKNQPHKKTPAEMMARYSPPNNKNSVKTAIRDSRLNQQNIVAEAANVLNVLPIEIINEMKKGKTLAQVAKDKGLSEVEFNKKLTDFDTKLVDKAIKDGTITKEHGDAIKAGRADRIKNGMKEKAMKAHSAMDMGN